MSYLACPIPVKVSSPNTFLFSQKLAVNSTFDFVHTSVNTSENSHNNFDNNNNNIRNVNFTHLNGRENNAKKFNLSELEKLMKTEKTLQYFSSPQANYLNIDRPSSCPII